MKILLFPQWEHDFHKIAFFTFSSNFDPKWDPKTIYFGQKRVRRAPKITKNRFFPKKAVPGSAFLSISHAISVRSRIPDRFWEGLNLQNPIISTVGARFSQNHGFHFFLQFAPQMGPQIQGFSPKTRAERPQNHQNNRKK